MRSRRLLALAGLCALLALAGCFGPSSISDEQLRENATYDWETDADAAYNLTENSYQAVYNITNSSSLSIHSRDLLGVDEPVSISALQFRFTNGTVVNATHPGLAATQTQSETEIDMPAGNGSLAYTATRSGKQFATPVAVEGSQTALLPPDTRVGVPILSHVQPGGYNTSMVGDRMEIRWESVTDGGISVRYYLQRDLLIFGGLLAVALVVGAGGLVYYLRKIKRLEAIREEVGLDVDQDEDDPGDRGPPPGMG